MSAIRLSRADFGALVLVEHLRLNRRWNGSDRNRTALSEGTRHAHLSTSIVERQNHNMRMSMRRFIRLTNGFSKSLENLGEVALHFAHYNMVRVHRTLRVTPAMAAGVENRLWTLQELVEETSK